MRRIAILGNSGTGKSTLAQALGLRLGLPVIHLDAHYWRPGWVEPPDAEWAEVQARLVAGDDWIVDGNYQRTLRLRMARADTIVFLDLPRRTAVRGVLSRLLRHRGTVRSDMAPGCPERADMEFWSWVWNYHRRSRPKVLAALAEFEGTGGTMRILRSRREIAEFLEGLPAP